MMTDEQKNDAAKSGDTDIIEIKPVEKPESAEEDSEEVCIAIAESPVPPPAAEDEKNQEEPEKDNKKNKSSFIKKLFKFILWLLLILIVSLTLLIIFRDSVVKTVVPVVGKWAVGVDISIGEFETSLAEGRLRIAKVKISNPEGYEEPALLSLDELVVDLKPETILTQEIILEEITIDNLAVLAEIARSGKLNFVKLNEYVQNKFSSPEAESEPESEPEQKPAPRQETAKPAPAKEENVEPDSQEEDETVLIIQQFKLKGKFVILDDRIGLRVPIPLNYSENDISTKPDYDESFAELFNKLTNLIQALVDSILGAGGQISSSAQTIFNNTLKNTGSILESGSKGVSNTIDAVKKLPNIFKFGSGK